MAAEPATAAQIRAGYLYGLAAFTIWGVFPVYFKWLGHVPALDLTAHRILWSVPFLVVIAAAGRRLGGLPSLVAGRRLLVFVASALAISGVWFIYIWAIAVDRLLEASLGYYITPLMAAMFGVIFLKERPTPRQWFAFALATVGVGILIARFGAVPWVALGLAMLMPTYTLIRKLAPADPVSGLLIETLLMSPFMVALLLWLGPHSATATADVPTWALLAVSGVVTAVPLIWFIAAARRLSLVAISLIQFISPSLNFLLAVVLYAEPFTAAHMAAFAFIWVALAIHTAESVRPK